MASHDDKLLKFSLKVTTKHVKWVVLESYVQN